MDTSSAFTAPFISTLTTDTVFDPLIDLEEGTYYWRVATALPPSGFTLPDSFTITATAARHPISASYSIPSPSVPALLGGARAPYLLVRGARARSLTVMVVSAGGRRVFTGSYNPRNGAARIALPSLPAGIYFIGVGARDARRLDFRRYVLR
jgi:hypothetical protein